MPVSYSLRGLRERRLLEQATHESPIIGGGFLEVRGQAGPELLDTLGRHHLLEMLRQHQHRFARGDERLHCARTGMADDQVALAADIGNTNRFGAESNENLRRSLACAAVAAALGLPAGTADAVVYSSSFDPVTFEGTATFDVNQACLDAGPGWVDNGYDGCVVDWLSANVTLKDDPYTAALIYDPPTNAVNRIWVNFADGELGGVDSNVIGPETTGHTHPAFNGNWWIQYTFIPSPPSDFVALAAPASLEFGEGNGLYGFGIVNLFTGPSCPSAASTECTFVDSADVRGFVRVTQIPEPGTLGLILGALGGAWFARWRKKIAA